MTKMVRKTQGWGVNFWASENWSGQVHFEGHSPEWRVLSKLSVQPCYLLVKMELRSINLHTHKKNSLLDLNKPGFKIKDFLIYGFWGNLF